MEEYILAQLSQIEIEKQVKIVYACESGSRAWGFPSRDSDYDVRFIYLHPLEWYLSVSEKRDVIEYPPQEKMDISGWEFRKALRLLRKTNPPLIEWLGSPIVYLERYSVAAGMRQLAKEYYSPAACLYHYLHMARGNYRDYLKGETVWVKKYFYVLRPLLAMRWIEEERGIVPTDFNVMVRELELPHELKDAIQQLIESKKSGEELDRGARIATLSDFVESELARWENKEIPPRPFFPEQMEEFDRFFRKSLAEVWQIELPI
ncbi:MAG: nucleotidyltransferase domain-containing protein [Anaerolineales bacterium]|nr:nucleotidyltransferase domain-containing protein [Anaerolineales bacterium]